MSTYNIACTWIANGYSVIPIRYRDKRPAFDALKLTGQKHGAGWGEFKKRQATDEELQLWFVGPRRNIGIVTGFAGLVVIDFDSPAAYSLWSSWAQAADGLAAEVAAIAYRVTSRRGVHLYIQVQEPTTSFAVGIIDIKARWGYVLGAGSVHPNGHVYTAIGAGIPTIERLSDVFPIQAQAAAPRTTVISIDDPWESAARAVETTTTNLQEIKATVSLQDILDLPVAAGRYQMVHCPLHADTQPSMRLYADGHFHCFGCGAHGDVFDLYAALHNLTNREAIAALAERSKYA